jgi:hypothetical protein
MYEQDKSNTMPWDFPDVGTPEEERKKHATPPFAPDVYIAECASVAMVETDDKYSPTGKRIQLEWKFKILSNFNGEPASLDNGQVARFNNFTVWSRTNQTGVDKQGKPQLTASIMRALLNIPRDQPIPSPKPEMFVGKKVRVSAEVGAKQDGTPKNIWSSFAPLKAAVSAPSEGVGTANDGGVQNNGVAENVPGSAGGDGSVEPTQTQDGQSA